MAPPEPVSKYGMLWKPGTSDLSIEFAFIKAGGYLRGSQGEKCGLGLFAHFMAARKLLWPERSENKWLRLIYEEILKNIITILMGAASTGKTATAAEYILIDYWVHPNNTLVLVTTTNVDKLETNIFGEIKELWRKGRQRYPWLAGNIVDHKHAIFTDDIATAEIRDQRRGIRGKACYEGSQWVGDSVFVGIKQERVRFIGDELQYMAGTFIRAWNPLFANPDLKVIGSGNPNHNPDDPLGIAAEPKEGWSTLPEPEVTTCWDTRYMNGRCVNLVGTDSPNFDVPDDQPEPYRYLIGRRFLKRVIHDSGLNSPEYYRLVKGVMNFSLAHTRVINRQLCRQHKAHDKAEWSGGKRTKIYAVDPAYGGGDRCVIGYVEFGESVDGKQILNIVNYRALQINLRLTTSPEDQIANAVYDDLLKYDILPKNAFYGAFGKGTIGFAFARKFGADSPVPIEEGGRPSRRPVRQDLRVYDETRRELRHKRCDEHYDRKISELWFSVRYCVEAEQLRNLSEEMMAEGCSREYGTVAGDKIAIETKEDMKERLARSPDLFDWLTFGVEGARQRGFVIASLGPEGDEEGKGDDWLTERVEKHLKLVMSKRLVVRT